MGYPAIPLSKVLQDSIVGWSVYACLAVVVVAAVSVAIAEHRERRRLERALEIARQVPPFQKDWTPRPAPDAGRVRLWLFPLVAILLGLIVGFWAIWDVLD